MTDTSVLEPRESSEETSLWAYLGSYLDYAN